MHVRQFSLVVSVNTLARAVPLSGIVAAHELESRRFQLLDLGQDRAVIRFATNDQTSFQGARDHVLFE
jgi:hypothetical protein